MHTVSQGDLNLNICEAHAFNTQDRFSLDVFVVNEWKGEVRHCRVSCVCAMHAEQIWHTPSVFEQMLYGIERMLV